MRNLYILFILFILILSNHIRGQTGTEFWFAAPEVTSQHNDVGPKFRFTNTSGTLSANVTVTMPAQPWTVFTPTPIVIAPNGTATLVLDAAPNSYKDTIENKPTNTVLNKGIHITSDVPITAYYEVDNSNNNEIFALKGANALGTEFYIPLTSYNLFPNHVYGAPPLAYASFDIVATENNTQVLIYSKTAVDGHAAGIPFAINLNKGQTYSCGWTGANYQLPSTHPSGAAVSSNKKIAITVKDDSDHNPSGGCYDLTGDQIVPVNVVGTEYVINQGGLNQPAGDESFFVMATENNTQVYINGSSTPDTTLFAGQEYRYEISAVTGQERTYVRTSKPAYLTHFTGFGCELGSAVFPPITCAGSEQVSIVRSSTEAFFLILIVKNIHKNSFQVNGNSTLINVALFDTVPGTNGVWVSLRQQFTTAEIPVGVAQRITNSAGVFSLGLINGGATTGCRYGYFSEFVYETVVNAGPDQIVCENKDTVQLNGTITGGSATGTWSSSGSGSFIPSADSLNALYDPSFSDISAGHVTLTLTSTGQCTPVSDEMDVTIEPAPIVNAGIDKTVCANNSNVNLNGSVIYATGGQWSGGTGTYNPNNTTLGAVYTPSAAEISSGSLLLTLTSTGNGTCDEEKDIMSIIITPAPVVSAGPDQSVCKNNPAVSLSGSVTIGGIGHTGQWTGGAGGSFSPGDTWLSTIYNPSAADLSAGSVTLTLTSTNNGNCNSVSDMITIYFTPIPTVNAGSDQTVCVNKPNVSLNGTITLPATGGQWTGGLGIFTPNSTTLNAVYSPTASEISSGNLTLTLTTTGNGNCNAVNDVMIIYFTPAPTVNAGSNQTVCANKSNVSLNGTVTLPATGGQWTGGLGIFTPNSTTLNAIYTPSSGEISAGTAKLYLTTTGSGNCNEVTDSMTITITPAPVVNAGIDQSVCKNKAVISLSGSVSNPFSNGFWSGGNGTYNLDSTDLDAVYTPTAAEIASGSLTLTLTSTNNGICNPVSDIMIVTFTDAPTVNAGIDQSICADKPNVSLNGTVTLPATGGQWTGGLGIFSPDNTTLNAIYSPTVSEVTSGSITLTLTTTGNGNCNAVSDEMLVTYTDAPIVNAGLDISVCANNPNVSLNGSVNGGTITGKWTTNGAGVFIPNDSTLNATYIPNGSDTLAKMIRIILTSTNNQPCPYAYDTLIVTFIAHPFTKLGNDTTLCADDTLLLNGYFLNDSSYQWQDGSIDSTYLVNSPGIYWVKVVNQCGSYADTIMIGYDSIPIARLGNDTGLCMGDTLLLASLYPKASYLWQDGSTNSTYSVTTTGIYWVEASNHCGSDRDSINVYFQYLPIVNLGNDTALCSGDSFILIPVTTDNSYLWQDGSIDSIFMVTSPNIYWVKVINQCGSDADTIIIGYDSIPTVKLDNDTILCAGDTLLLASFYPKANYLWQDGSTDSTYSVTTTGTYWVEVTNHCGSERDSIYVYFKYPPVVDLGSDTILCLGDTLLLNAYSFNDTSYLWQDSLSYSTYLVSSPGIYWVKVTNQCGYSVDTIIIGYDSIPTAKLGDDTVLCTGDTLILASIQPKVNYLWQDGSTDSTYFVTTTGTYWVEVSNHCGSDRDSINVYFQYPPTVFLGNDTTLCLGDTFIIIPVTSDSNYLWQDSSTDSVLVVTFPSMYWVQMSNACGSAKDTIIVNFNTLPFTNFPNDTTLCDGDVLLLNASQKEALYLWQDGSTDSIFTVSSEGTYWVQIFNICGSVIDSTFVNYESPPVIDLGPDTTLCLGYVILDPGYAVPNQILWITNGDTSKLLKVTKQGLYIVRVTNIYGCFSTDSIRVINNCIFTIYVPNAFTPNASGLNDIFKAVGINIVEFNMWIYDRWGEQLFESHNIDYGWDGTYKNTNVEMGVYVWVIKARGKQGSSNYYEDINMEGTVLLIR